MGWTERAGDKFRGVYRHPNGKRPKRTFRYEWEAQSWADTEEAKALGRPDPNEGATSGMLLADYGERWLTRRTGVQPSTMQKYGQWRDQIAASPLGFLPLDQVTADLVERWFHALDQDPMITARMRNDRLKAFRMITKQAIRDGLLASDPSAGVRSAKLPMKARRGFLSDDEIRELVAAAKAPEWGSAWRVMFDDGELELAILLGADAGLRWCEIAALSTDSVIRQGSKMFLHIWQAASKSSGRIKPNPKGGEERFVPVTPRLRDAVERRSRRARLAHGKGALLISRADGSPIRYRWSEMHLDSAATQAGISVKGWHDLRHRYGSRLAELGTATKQISSLMGHTEEAVTQLYMHRSSLDALDSVIERAALGA